MIMRWNFTDLEPDIGTATQLAGPRVSASADHRAQPTTFRIASSLSVTALALWGTLAITVSAAGNWTAPSMRRRDSAEHVVVPGEAGATRRMNAPTGDPDEVPSGYWTRLDARLAPMEAATETE